MKRILFANGEFYHVYNRGTDKRIVFDEDYDLYRFMQSMDEFNVIEPIGSIYENSFRKDNDSDENHVSNIILKEKLVNIIAYCLNPNHFHLILEQLVDGGISEFMKRLSGGYSWYFNNKYKRSGVLFQGRFKSVHINSNEYLLYVSAYVNLNDKVHQLNNQLGGPTAKLDKKLVKSKSSWEEYTIKRYNKKKFCTKGIILNQFETTKEYERFAQKALKNILENKAKARELSDFLLE